MAKNSGTTRISQGTPQGQQGTQQGQFIPLSQGVEKIDNFRNFLRDEGIELDRFISRGRNESEYDVKLKAGVVRIFYYRNHNLYSVQPSTDGVSDLSILTAVEGFEFTKRNGDTYITKNGRALFNDREISAFLRGNK